MIIGLGGVDGLAFLPIVANGPRCLGTGDRRDGAIERLKRPFRYL